MEAIKLMNINNKIMSPVIIYGVVAVNLCRYLFM